LGLSVFGLAERRVLAQTLFKELDKDGSGGLSPQELRGYKTLLFTGRSQEERADERKWAPGDERRKPTKAPPSDGSGKDLDFAGFVQMFEDKVTNEKQPHGHHKAFMALDKNADNYIQPHELNGLERYIRNHPDL